LPLSRQSNPPSSGPCQQVKALIASSRASLSLQDRLVKELRLRGIRDVEAANAFAPAFIADYDRRFARAPRSEHDAQRFLQPSDDLARVFR
jgi:hypothetical protein